MAIDFISITTTAPQAALLKSGINLLISAQNQLNAALGIMNHNNDGTNFTQIETLFGLPTGKGQIVFDLLNGTIGSMNGSFQNNNSVTITQQVG